MIHRRIENRNILEEREIISPDELKALFPLTESDVTTVQTGQQTVKEILLGKDPRTLVIVGPCSIHDSNAAIEYAQRLQKLSERVKDKLYLVMRVYFEKPRTTVGWQGFITDPYLNDSYQIEEGLKKSRALLLKITRLGLPVAGEALDIVTPPYIQDLISYTAIGARTVESQSHRKMASGLTSAVGFKNATEGSIDLAINAIHSAQGKHVFVSINPSGKSSIIQTNGNPHGHIILRGGKKPNYSPKDILSCEKSLKAANLPATIIVDCSHGNSLKDHNKQTDVFNNVIEQISGGTRSIKGIMMESHLKEGNQPLLSDPKKLEYGVSITDACISWETTEALILEAHAKF